MASVDIEDAELVERARSGDSEAFSALMLRHERLVYRVVRAFARNREDALDLTQATFLKAFRALGGFRRKASFKTWLLRIAHHEGLNWTRDRRHQSGTDVEEVAPRLAQPAEQERTLLAEERLGRVRRALAGIHGRYRTAIVLRYLDQLPIREIAAVLGTSEAMTKNLLFRGVRRLRRAVEETS